MNPKLLANGAMGGRFIASFGRLAPQFGGLDGAALKEAAARSISGLRKQALADQTRWPLWLPVALGAGIGVYFALPIEPIWPLAVMAACIALVACAVSANSHKAPLRIAMALLAAASLGFAVAKIRTEAVGAPVLSRKMGPVGIDGRVESVQAHGEGMRLVLGAVVLRRLPPERTPALVRVSVRSGADALIPGQWIHLTAVLLPPPGPAVPDGHDFGLAAYYERIGAVGYAYGRPKLIAPRLADGWNDRIKLSVAKLRWQMTARIHAVLPGSIGGIASALITGDRGAIADEDEQALRDAGLAHVLAIAGLHMALVGLGLFWTVRALLALIPAIALRYPIKKWAALAALASAAFYLVISGAATPATRAFVMLATMLLAVLFDRPALSMRSLGLAATIIFMLRPENLLEPGFQMSFSAVVSLIAVAEWEQARRARRMEPRGPQRFAAVRRYMRGIATTSLVGSLATAPYAVFHFDRATHYAVLGNLLAMPVMGFVTMPAAALSVILMPFGLDAWPLRVMGWGIEIMLSVGRFVSGLPGAVSILSAWPIVALVLLSLGGLWIAIWRRAWRWFGLVPMLAGVAAAYAAPGPDVLVARDALTIAVRGSDGLLRFVRPPKDDYSASEWLKRDGDERDSDSAVATPDNGVRCDAYGCIAKARNGTLIALPSRIDALAEDCATAKLVISAVPTRGYCNGPQLIIDKFDVAKTGGYAIWLGDPWRIKTVEGERGRRPWSAQLSKRATH
ncbi:MAG: ComEC/Rec2 family competence protein [Rhizomicrobium sp.]